MNARAFLVSVTLLLFSSSLASAQAANADVQELKSYTLTDAALKQFVAATRQLLQAVKADPRYSEIATLQRDLQALEAKDDLTEAEIERIETLTTRIEALEQKLPDIAVDISEKQTLSQIEAALRKEPLIANALKSAGMAPREYAKFALALFQAAMIHGMQKAGMMKELPKELEAQVNLANLQFVAAHEAEIAALTKEFQAFSQQ